MLLQSFWVHFPAYKSLVTPGPGDLNSMVIHIHPCTYLPFSSMHTTKNKYKYFYKKIWGLSNHKQTSMHRTLVVMNLHLIFCLCGSKIAYHRSSNTSIFKLYRVKFNHAVKLPSILSQIYYWIVVIEVGTIN